MKIYTTLGALILTTGLSAFTIINQTDEPKTVYIQAADRPEDEEGQLKEPIARSDEVNKINIGPHTRYEEYSIEECPTILVHVVKEERLKEGDRDFSRTTTSTTCCDAYDVDGDGTRLIDNEWGIAFVKPYKSQDFGKEMMMKRQGYGIKYLHPTFLKEITSNEELPENFKN